MGKKSKGGGSAAPAPPPAPDYSAIANAQSESAQISAQIAREQLDWAKAQYHADRQITDQVVSQAMRIQEEEAAAGRADRARYQSVFQPVEDSLVREAQDYATPQRVEVEAGRAAAGVNAQFEAARRGAIADLESYGIDPSQTRSQAMDLSMRMSQAAASAGAANLAGENVINQARALRSEALNVGKGYGSQIAGAYGTALQAGNQAINGQLATTQSGANTMGTGMQWMGQQNNALNGWANTMGMQAQGQQQAYANQLGQQRYSQQRRDANRAGMFGGLGTIAGGIVGASFGGPMGALMGAGIGGGAFGRSFVEGGRVTANPSGGPPTAITPEMSPTAGAVTDDVPITANEGEMVVPEDVVKWKGEEFFHKLAIKARGDMGDPNPKGLGPPGGGPPPKPRRSALPMGA